MNEGDGKVTDIKHDDEVEKDLGVLFDTKLSFRQHIGCTVNKVNRMIGLTRRTFHYMDQEVFRLLFTSLMRPHMDYADCIWSPHLKVDIAQLENAQRRATRLVPDLRDRCYEHCLIQGPVHPSFGRVNCKVGRVYPSNNWLWTGKTRPT